MLMRHVVYLVCDSIRMCKEVFASELPVFRRHQPRRAFPIRIAQPSRIDRCVNRDVANVYPLGPEVSRQ